MEIDSALLKVFGSDFIGATAVKQVLIPGFEGVSAVELTPQEQELERLRKVGNFIIDRTDKAPDGEPLTMNKMFQLLRGEFNRRNLGEILYNYDGSRSWLESQAFFMEDTPRAGRFVVSKGVIPGSLDEDYGSQIGILESYILEQVPASRSLSDRGQEAMKEWEDQKDYLRGLLKTDWRNAVEGFVSLKLPQLYSPRPVDGLYDLAVPLLVSGERRLVGVYTRTNRLSSGGVLVALGYFDPSGADVGRWNPGSALPRVGVCLSAELKDLGF